MLQNSLEIIYAWVISVSWGFPIIFLFRKDKAKDFAISIECVVLSFFCGVSLISFSASVICLLLPLSYKYLIILSLPFIGITLKIIFKARLNTKEITAFFAKKNFFYVILFIASALLFLILSSGKPVMEDTDLYHLQIIRWNNEYGTVRGLANIFPKYGTYSNWLQLISFFALPFAHKNFLSLNTLLTILVCFYLLYKIWYYQQRQSQVNRTFALLYLFIFLFMMLEWNLFRGTSSSTNFDFIVTSLISFILITLSEDFELNNYSRQFRLFPLILVVAAIPFFKMSGSLFLLAWFTYLVVIKSKLKSYLAFACTICLFSIPFFIRNYWQTGYFFYPYTILAFFSPDWQLPLSLANKHVDYISLSNKFLNRQIPVKAWLNPSTTIWMKGWLSRLTKFDFALICIAIAGIPLSFFSLRTVILKKKNNILLVYTACLVGLIAWFFSAPDPRFVYGLLLFTGFLNYAIIFSRFVRKYLVYTVLSAALITISIYGFNKLRIANLINPATIISPSYEVVLINGTRYNLPEKVNNNWNRRCYYTNLPCIYERNPYLEARGNSLKEGFRMEKPDSNFVIHYYY
jgi:hypothetical protein